uniref:NADH-ubiquinone oxidoreductase chain 5 n=1 Tax=Haedus sp. TaxID=2931292 RepID=A0A8T9ZXQ2_9HEMI|nr:NADH dehydrogenase subunit 5 [Haedus sp.]
MIYNVYFFFLMFFSIIFFILGFIFFNFNLSFLLDWEVFTLNSVCVSLTFYVDWMSLIFCSTVLLISSMVILYSYDYMFMDMNNYRFLLLVFMFVVSMILMIFSLNMISILLGWDGLGLVSYCLVIFYQNNNSYNSGMLTILTNRLGDAFILICIAWFFNFGGFHFVYYLNMSYNWLQLFVILLIIAGFTKSAQIPFSSWLPAAMAAPTPVSSLVHSSTLVTAGVYLLIRFCPLLVNSCYLDFFFILSVLTMFMAGLGANFNFDLKKIVAFSTLSQLGLMMSILFTGNYDLSFFHLLSHAFFKSLLFMCSGLFIHSMCDSQDIRLMGFLSKEKPYSSVCFMIGNLSLCGMFFTSGFYSKDLIVENLMFHGNNFMIIIIYLLSLSLTVCYTVRLIFYLMKDGVSFFTFRSLGEGFSTMSSFIILFVFSLIFGSFFNWSFFESLDNLFFPFYMKMMIPSFMLLGIFMFYMSLLHLNLNFMSFFLAGMWYLNFLGSVFFNVLYYNVCLSYKHLIDNSWGEYYFSFYLSSAVHYISLKLNYVIFNNLKIYLISFILFMIYFMF